MKLWQMLLDRQHHRSAPARPTSTDPGEHGRLGAAVRQVLDAVDSLLGVEKVQELTYRDAVKHFVNGRPDDDRVAKGALVCRPAGFGQLLLIWLFLDGNGQPLSGTDGTLLGRRQIVSSLDDELAACFDRHDILIVE